MFSLYQNWLFEIYSIKYASSNLIKFKIGTTFFCPKKHKVSGGPAFQLLKNGQDDI